MPYRDLVVKRLGELFNVLSHPLRIRIVEELHGQEKDVNSLSQILGISHSGVSQHLSLMKAHGLLVERRQGRNVFYRLRQEDVAAWALDGLKFVGPLKEEVEEFQSAKEKARALWVDDQAKSG